MRDLIMEEVTSVAGGEIVCTFGFPYSGCTGTLLEWTDAFFGAYDNAVESFTDLFMWIDDQFPDNGTQP